MPGPGAGAPTGGGEGGGEGGEGTDRQMGAGYQRLISQEESDKKLDKRIKEAVKIVNKPLNKLLTQAALGVWEASIPSVGVSILLGAIVGDFLWAFKKQLVKRFLKLVPGWSSGKEIPTYNEAEKAQGFQNIKEQPLSQMISVDKIAEQVKISGTVKLHIIAMNLIVISVPLLVVFFILMVAVIGCNYPPNPSPSVLRALGYGEYCDAIKTAGQNQNFSGFGGGTSGGGGASGSW